MFDSLVNLLNDNTPLSSPGGRVVVILVVVALAWLASRASALAARRVLIWHERRHRDADLEVTGQIANLKRQETLVSVIRTGITYLVFAVAAIVIISQLTGGIDRLTALAGASFALILAGFAVQRILVDILAGLMMFVERWYSVGDTVTIHAGMELQGVVEDVSLRRTRLRALSGEVIHVHNSQVQAVRLLPRGVKELAIEVFVAKREPGERLVEDVVRILPEGPTTFIRRPWIEHVEELAHNLTRIRLHATVAPGREWLAEEFFTDLLKQRASDSLIVHGPVAFAVDERANRSYARASATTRSAFGRSQRNAA
ncbi:MAG: mechanosensitive ion channel family protein [Gaiellaceae bacterium]